MNNICAMNKKIQVVLYLCRYGETCLSRVFTRILKISLASCNVKKNSAPVLFFSFLANSLADRPFHFMDEKMQLP